MLSLTCILCIFPVVMATPGNLTIYGPDLEFEEEFYQGGQFHVVKKNQEISDDPETTTGLPSGSTFLDCARICLEDANCLATNYREGVCETFNKAIKRTTIVERKGSIVAAFQDVTVKRKYLCYIKSL